MSKHSAYHEHAGQAASVHDAMRKLLPAYATAIALSHVPETQYPDAAAHLEGCAECRETLEDLIDLTSMAYSDTFPSAPAYPQPDLSFLRSSVPEADTRQRWESLAATGRLIIKFSEPLLASLRQSMRTGAARGQTLYRYTQRTGNVPNLSVSVDVYAQESQRDRCYIQVGVEVLSRDPLDQAASLVRLRADDMTWEGVTDESGCVGFQDVPLAVLPRLTIEIAPPPAD
jgi:hypothetical protein